MAIVRLPDGGVVFGGSFSSVNGVLRANIAKMRPDGTLDPDWNPSASHAVNALATDAAGNVYVGGEFITIGGQSRSHIAKLSSNGVGMADVSWDPSANSGVLALAVDSGGSVYAAGDFTTIGGQSRHHIAKLSSSGSGDADANWDPLPDFGVTALAIDGTGVYVGGTFSIIGGQNRAYIAKLSATGTGAADTSWDPSPSGAVFALAIDAGGNVYAGGDFTTIGGQNRNHVAKLSGGGTGAANVNWDPSVDKRVVALATDSGGNVYLGGDFTTIGGQNRGHIAKLSGTGVVDTSWYPADNDVRVLIADGNGGVHAGGDFTNIGGQARLGFATLVEDGTASAAVDAEVPAGPVLALAKQAGGGMIVGGNFQKANGLPRANILRLQPDGTLDPIWNPSVTGEVRALATDASGNVFAGGYFTHAGGLERSNIAKISVSGVVDPDWDPSANGSVWALVANANGNIYVGGAFGTIGGLERNSIAKLAGADTGAADPSWNPAADGVVLALAVAADGDVYAGGLFSTIGGQSRDRIAKLMGSGTGAADANWDPSADGLVSAFAVSASGDIYVGGNFKNIGGQIRSGIAKLSSSGTGAADANWDPSANGGVVALTIDMGGNVYAGGSFSSIGGQDRFAIAKLSGSGVGAAYTDWNPFLGAYGFVRTLATDASDDIYVGGSFTTINNQDHARVAAFQGERIFYDGFDK